MTQVILTKCGFSKNFTVEVGTGECLIGSLYAGLPKADGRAFVVLENEGGGTLHCLDYDQRGAAWIKDMVATGE